MKLNKSSLKSLMYSGKKTWLKRPKLSDLWHTLAKYPLGRWIFAKLIAVYAPYSGSIKAQVLTLDAES